MSTTPAMMTQQMLSDKEYLELETRVLRGKEILQGKWGATDYETKTWINLWFTLSDQLIAEMKRRNMFQPKVPVDPEGHLEKIREQMIAKGLVKKPKEKKSRRKKEDQDEALFQM